MENETFVIDNDQKAEWSLKKIKSIDEEYSRLIGICKDEIGRYTKLMNEYEHKRQIERGNLLYMLSCYFNTVPTKVTKTQATYLLPSGKLVKKLPKIKLNHDEEKLLDILQGTEFVENKPNLKWGEYKKTLKVVNDKVVDENGEIIEGVTIEIKPEVFDVDIK